MNLADLHLLLNHFPVIGTLITAGVFILGLIQRSDALKRAGLVLFLGLSLLSIAVYISGNAAAEAICDGKSQAELDGQDAMAPTKPCKLPLGVSRALIQIHETAAFEAFAVMELTGAFAWLGLWQFRRFSRFPGATLSVVLILSLFTLALMTRAANLGGAIRHPEIAGAVGGSAPPAPIVQPEDLLARRIGAAMEGGVRWGWPTCETLHFIGLSLLFGIATLIDLRMLGLMKGISFAALHRLLPWGILGFAINAVTGFLFFVATPWQYTYNGAFQWKIALILLAGLNVVYFTIFDSAWAVKAGQDAPFTAKFAAASALVLVVGVIFCGRMLPFLGNSF